ncbi:transmembrane protein 70 homolog, mitochondrial-like [Ornithodoros turicata]|uniref:transmembrane protein 70 homolog, mitochondrial-like n=1 Tax=Ornithodoros turicata TaxID=34597 RepID=UPI0031397CE9
MASLIRGGLLPSKCLIYTACCPNWKCATRTRLICLERPPMKSVTTRHGSTSTPPGQFQYDAENHNTIVYSGSLRSTLKLVKGFSLTTSFVGVLVQPILLQKLMDKPIGVALTVVATTSFFIVVTPLLLHLIAKRYVTELTFNSSTQTFEATTLTLLNRQTKMSFSAADVKVPEIPGALTTFLVKGRPLFVDPQLFQDVDALERLMGYDKPIDWHLEEPSGKVPEQATDLKKET